MELRLPHPPTPEHAPRHAALAVEAALASDGTVLDHGPESLAYVDALIARFHANGLPADDVGASVFALGRYVGEVLLRSFGGRWLTAGESIEGGSDGGDDALVVELHRIVEATA